MLTNFSKSFSYSIFPHIGGKTFLIKPLNVIVNHLPDIINCYCEPFAGSAKLFFYKEKKFNIEALNDLDSEIYNFLIQVRDNVEKLDTFIKDLPYNEEFLINVTYKKILPKNDLERAGYFYYTKKLLNLLYKYTFFVRNKKNKNYICINKKHDLRTFYNILKDTLIYNKNYLDVINLLDNKKTFFYIDPPYYGAENYYEAEFKREEHIKLRDYLKNLLGLFVLSYEDCKEIRELYKDFFIYPFEVKRFSAATKAKTELLITNFKIDYDLSIDEDKIKSEQKKQNTLF